MGNQQNKEQRDGLAWAPAIQHPLDRAYIKKIEGLPLMPKIMGWVVDRQREEAEAMLAGDCILVTEETLPDAWEAFRAACAALDLDPAKFQFFVEPVGAINAYTTGSEVPIVVATSGLVNAFTRQELTFVLGHELGHYVCGHVRCHALARFLTNASEGLGRIFGGVAELGTWLGASSIRPLLMSWSRYSELSADRAGLLACRDFDTACRAYLKMGGFPHLKPLPEHPAETLKAQCVAYAKNAGRFSVIRRMWREMGHVFRATHPRVVERFTALDDWVGLGCHEELVDATTEERIRIADQIGTDYLRNELNLAVVENAADYVAETSTVPRKDALRLLRGAFLHGGDLRDTALSRLLYAELAVAKAKGDSLSYTLSLLMADGGGSVSKVSIPVDYTPDPDFAPDAIRAKFIESRQQELKILVYQPKTN